MAVEETVQQFLDRREKELTAQISALRGRLSPKEAELAQIRQMKAALEQPKSLGDLVETPSDSIETLLGGSSPAPTGLFALGNAVGRYSSDPLSPPSTYYSTMTIKESVIQALLDHFREGGTAAAIREFIRNAYGRIIEPSSLRPQMHRLKADNILMHEPSMDTWNLTANARR